MQHSKLKRLIAKRQLQRQLQQTEIAASFSAEHSAKIAEWRIKHDTPKTIKSSIDYNWLWENFLNARGEKIAAIIRCYIANPWQAQKIMARLAHYGIASDVVSERANYFARMIHTGENTPDYLQAVYNEFNAYFKAFYG